MIRTKITPDPINTSELHEWAKDSECGAIVTFSGTTRNDFGGKTVTALSYDCYVPLAERTLERIATAASARAGVHRIALVHRIGLVPVKEESIFIAVSAEHRQEGWHTAEWVLEEVKRSTEIWKREEYADGSKSWIEGIPRISA